MLYLVIGPFGIFLLFRVILPLFWCFNFLITNDIATKNYDIVLLHFIYLIFQGTIFLLLMVFCVNKVIKLRKQRFDTKYIYRTNKMAIRSIKFILFGLFLFLAFNYSTLPIFMDRGSDSIVLLNEQETTKTWFMYGLLGVLLSALVISIIYLKSRVHKYFSGTLFVLFFLVTGKKSALISSISKLVFVYYTLNNKKPKLPIIKLGIMLFISIVYIVYQFIQTSGIDINVFEGLGLIFRLVYNHGTIYLHQFIIDDGVSLASIYSENLGNGGSLLYFFNPFLKFLFGIGIDKAIGPFLSYELYGNPFPNGVNPTFFFEVLFVSGTKYGVFLAFVFIFCIFFIARYFFNKLVNNFNKSILLSTSYLLLFLSCFGILTDSLNTIRSLPFAFFPLFIYFVIQILPKKRVCRTILIRDENENYS